MISHIHKIPFFLAKTQRKKAFKKYVDSWRKKQLFLLDLNVWKASQQAKLTTLTRSKEANGLLDRLFLAFLRFYAKTEQVFAMLYFFVLHRYFPIQIIRRNVVSFVRRVMLRI